MHFCRTSSKLDIPSPIEPCKKGLPHLPGLEYRSCCRCNTLHVPSSAEDDLNPILHGDKASWCKAAGPEGALIFTRHMPKPQWLRKLRVSFAHMVALRQFRPRNATMCSNTGNSAKLRALSIPSRARRGGPVKGNGETRWQATTPSKRKDASFMSESGIVALLTLRTKVARVICLWFHRCCSFNDQFFSRHLLGIQSMHLLLLANSYLVVPTA
jgi:hypothetical protein